MWRDLENKSAFVNLALEHAIGIMTFDILQKKDPAKYHYRQDVTTDDLLPEYNEKNPLDPLTAKRKGVPPSTPTSPNKPELW
jgi:hypothetical protein